MIDGSGLGSAEHNTLGPTRTVAGSICLSACCAVRVRVQGGDGTSPVHEKDGLDQPDLMGISMMPSKLFSCSSSSSL